MGMTTSRHKNMLQYILSSYWYVTKELVAGTRRQILHINRKETEHSNKAKNKIIPK